MWIFIDRLQKVSKGILPDEGTEEVEELLDPIQSSDISSAVRRLEKLDKHLYEQSGPSEKKRRKREKLSRSFLKENAKTLYFSYDGERNSFVCHS